MLCTGVPKSFTSSLRRNRSGRLVFMKSMTRDCPCRRMSIAACDCDRSTMTRPDSLLPRRKSTSSIALRSVAMALAAAPAAEVAASEKLSMSVLPCTRLANGSERFNASTNRVRPDTCTISTCRRSPVSSTCRAWPVAFSVSAKSSTNRGGLGVEKFDASAAGARRKLSFNCCSAPSRTACISVIAFGSARATPTDDAHISRHITATGI